MAWEAWPGYKASILYTSACRHSSYDAQAIQWLAVLPHAGNGPLMACTTVFALCLCCTTKRHLQLDRYMIPLMAHTASYLEVKIVLPQRHQSP